MNANANQEIDKFGRDNSLRKPNPSGWDISELINKMKGMSWADLCYELEEEEERLEKEARDSKLKVLIADRKDLLDKGEYELEEGEIFE